MLPGHAKMRGRPCRLAAARTEKDEKEVRWLEAAEKAEALDAE